MTPRLEAELITKCRRLFYDKRTGHCRGLASGGGALEALHGQALIIATYNDPDAPRSVGVVECYYSPVGKGKPLSVDLTKVSDMERTSQEFHDHLEAHDQLKHHVAIGDYSCCGETAAALCAARDACVTYAGPEPARGGGRPRRDA